MCERERHAEYQSQARAFLGVTAHLSFRLGNSTATASDMIESDRDQTAERETERNKDIKRRERDERDRKSTTERCIFYPVDVDDTVKSMSFKTVQSLGVIFLF